jgi:predicted nucleic acid-binding protein
VTGERFKVVLNLAVRAGLIPGAGQTAEERLSRIQAEAPRNTEEIMRESCASGRLTTDSHLATLAIERQAELHSNDADFSRFSGLR